MNLVADHLLVHVEDLRRSAHAVLSIHSHRTDAVGSDDEFLSTISVTVFARLSCCAPSRSPSAPLFSGKFFFLLFVIFLYNITCVLPFIPPFAPEFLVSRGGFGSPSPRGLAHYIKMGQPTRGGESRTLLARPKNQAQTGVGVGGHKCMYKKWQ